MLQLLASGGLQAKLHESQPGDADEQEADRAAEHVVSTQAAPRLQRKCACGGSCAQCQQDEETVIHRRARTAPTLRSLPFSIQRQAAPTEERSHRTAAADADTRGNQAKHPGEHPRTLIVEDDAVSVGPGQMRKREFVALLQTTTCATADAVLESVGHTTRGCPYIKKWLAHYQGQDAAHLTRAMRKYAPETGRARSAHEAIALVNQRVERAARTWAKTGKVTDLPEGIQEETAGGGGFLGAVMGFAHSGFGSALLGFVGGGKKDTGTSGGKVQRKSQGGASAGEPDAAAVHEQLGSGHALDGRVQRQMSSAFGYDFSGVRVHTDATAGELSGRLNARAFTIGRDVAFAAGEYQPGTLIGDALIAHELAHVVQQGAARGAAPQSKGRETDASTLEVDADQAAVGIVSQLWGGERQQQAAPRQRSGLRLSRCSKSVPKPTLPSQPTQADQKNVCKGSPIRIEIRRSADFDATFTKKPMDARMAGSGVSFIVPVNATDLTVDEEEEALLIWSCTDGKRGTEKAVWTEQWTRAGDTDLPVDPDKNERLGQDSHGYGLSGGAGFFAREAAEKKGFNMDTCTWEYTVNFRGAPTIRTGKKVLHHCVFGFQFRASHQVERKGKPARSASLQYWGVDSEVVVEDIK